MTEECIYVTNRAGRREELDPVQIARHIQNLAARDPKIAHINAQFLMLEVCKGLTSNITTAELNEQLARISADLSLTNPYYLTLAGRIAIDNYHKNTLRSFVDKMQMCRDAGLLSGGFMRFVRENADALEAMINYDRDFLLDFFGFRTFQRQYSMRINGRCVERPQDMFMRTAVALSISGTLGSKHTFVMNNIRTTYTLLSLKIYTHASPTYYNAGASDFPQYASCFLLGCGDSGREITQAVADMAAISKFSGGIGLHIHELRGAGAPIRSTNGKSSGIVPFIRMFETTMLAFNQGGRRPGSAKMYLAMHHPDIVSFVELRRNNGTEQRRARHLFYALWVPDLFMERVRDGGQWSLFDPYLCGDLSELHNDEYRTQYLKLEAEKRFTSQISARVLWELIAEVNAETGMPDLIFSDTANRCNMQSNFGTLKSSNLCDEIYQYSTTKPGAVEMATCVLASVSLGACVRQLDGQDMTDAEFPTVPCFDFARLGECVTQVVRNLNNLIDTTYHPTEAARYGNLRQRAIGIGVQGLYDAYAKMGYAFESSEAFALNKEIHEAIYYFAITASAKLSREYYHQTKRAAETADVYVDDYHGGRRLVVAQGQTPDMKCGAYPGMFENGGGPLSRGRFHWELYGLTAADLCGRFDWETTRALIAQFGVRNSLTTALMPTASTSQLLGNVECFEPITSNVYKRETSAGEFTVINKYLIRDLYQLNLWSKEMREYIIASEGSVQHIEGIPQELKTRYKTAFELDQAVIIEQAADRQPFVDQGQSMNLYVRNFTIAEWTRLMFLGWELGLKTGKYYLHTEAASMPTKFTIDPAKQKEMLQLRPTAKKIIDTVCAGCSA
jgi:ribonucleoside-diphosphate reductase alpha chain